ncbi:hypothetical protein HRG_010947 [Hirsutella rhossiliensis]|uniref:Secreted protein n=1 Tax=Hirsutella rhossiliensis TaxID=111463 RepID=A0A9P8MNX6_9HYPO|nr:uncharacterized protein HRG_10947 [Hirsutella rhossiliensis]KAH0957854.1 hypothetical protein HRG_10947 [Hirsutella rhossiliensis]
MPSIRGSRNRLLLAMLSVLLLSSTAQARPALTTDPRYLQRPETHDDPASVLGDVVGNWLHSWWGETPEPAKVSKHNKPSAPEGKKDATSLNQGALPAQNAALLDVNPPAEPENRLPAALPFDDVDENGYAHMDRPADPWEVANRLRQQQNVHPPDVDDGYVSDFSESGDESLSGQSSRPGSPYHDEANEPSRPATPEPLEGGEASGASSGSPSSSRAGTPPPEDAEVPSTSRGPAPASRPVMPPVDEAAEAGGASRVPSIGGSRPPIVRGGQAGGQAASLLEDAEISSAATTEATVGSILASIGTLLR